MPIHKKILAVMIHYPEKVSTRHNKNTKRAIILMVSFQLGKMINVRTKSIPFRYMRLHPAYLTVVDMTLDL